MEHAAQQMAAAGCICLDLEAGSTDALLRRAGTSGTDLEVAVHDDRCPCARAALLRESIAMDSWLLTEVGAWVYGVVLMFGGQPETAHLVAAEFVRGVRGAREKRSKEEG